LLRKLDRVRSIDADTVAFYAWAAGRLPEQVSDFFIRRLRHAWSGQAGYDFHPLPIQGLAHIFAAVSTSAVSDRVIRCIRGLARGVNRSMPRLQVARLFQAASGNYSQASLAVMTEWLESDDPTEVAAAVTLLGAVPPNWVFDHTAFVRGVLDRASLLGDEFVSDAIDILLGATSRSSRSGVAGRPFPLDLRQRDRADEVIASESPNTPMCRLFDRIRREADRSIDAIERRAGRD
jgi:hypothetical protein